MEIGFGFGIGIGWVLGVFCYGVYRMRPDTKEGTPSASNNRQIMQLPPSCGECPCQRTCKQHGGIPYAYGGLECLNIRRAATA